MTQALAPSPAPEPFEGSQMGLLGHLSELRDRMIWIVAALAIGTVVSFLFVSPLLEFITAPVGSKLQALGPTDTIGIFFRVGFASGAVIAMPVMVFQIVAFIAPGLFPHEKRTLLILMPGIMLLFFIGAAFAYFIMLPVAVDILALSPASSFGSVSFSRHLWSLLLCRASGWSVGLSCSAIGVKRL
jgi:sec-independent protein translocase protein TatC